ncbi:MAG: hypothetical protein BRC56_00105, partial [Cyanobacteria bacterium SW_9_47_5]
PEIFWSLTQTKNANDVLDDGARPLNLQANPDGAQVKVDLSWEVFSKDIVDYYNIYRSTSSNTGFTKINGTSTTSEQYTDDSVSDSTKYYYYVTGQTTNGTETDSTQTEAVEVFTITTLPATNINPEYATLNGEVGDPPEASTVNTFFEWGEEQGQGFPNSTIRNKVSGGSAFERTLFAEDQSIESTITASDAGDLVRPVDWDNENTGRLAAGSNDGNTYIYDTNINLSTTLTDASNEVRGVGWNKNTGGLAASAKSGEVFIYDSNLSLTNTLNDSTDIATGVEWDANTGRLAVGSWDGVIYVYDSNLNLVNTLGGFGGSVYDVAIDSNTGRICGGGSGNDLRVWDSSFSFIEENTYSSPVLSVDWDPFESRLAVVHEAVTFYGGENFNKIDYFSPRPQSRPNPKFRGCAWDPATGNLALADKKDDSYYIYTKDLDLVQILEDPSDEAVKVVWDNTNYRLAGSSADNNTYVYQHNTVLSSSTSYEFRAVGKYDGGSTIKGNTETFTTTTS